MLNISKNTVHLYVIFWILPKVIITSNYLVNTMLYTVISKSGGGDGTVTSETYK